MRIWRLIRQEFAPDLEGEGARLHGGRWNSPGVPVVYCSSSLALAVLETFVHLPHELRQRGNLPTFDTIGLFVPDDAVEHLEATMSWPIIASPNFKAAGDTWVNSGDSLGRVVPSAVITRENNVLLNPRHPRMAEVKVVVRETFVFDERLGG